MYHPVRICALGKKKEEIEKSYRHIKKSNSKEKRGKITDLQQIYSKYVLVACSLPETISVDQIFELYRMRWQMELVFKRLKSIFGGEFCAKKKESVEAWFYGKLLLSTICEIFIKQSRFSPCSQKQKDWEESIFSLERTESDALACFLYHCGFFGFSFPSWIFWPIFYLLL